MTREQDMKEVHLKSFADDQYEQKASLKKSWKIELAIEFIWPKPKFYFEFSRNQDELEKVDGIN